MKKQGYIHYFSNDQLPVGRCISSFHIVQKKEEGWDITGSSIYIGPLIQFYKFLSPFHKNFKTNDASIESTNKEHLDS